MRAHIGRAVELHWPALLVIAVCSGLALSIVLPIPLSVACAVAAFALVGVVHLAGPARLAALALALAAVGLAWGSLRMDALGQSVLARELGETGAAELVTVAPARPSPWSTRVVAVARTFRHAAVTERVLLVLPVGRSPPARGAILEASVRVAAPRPERDGFDERAWLERQGIHVVLHASSWREVDRRGGIAGLGDRLRGRIEDVVESGTEGVRRAIVLGVVLGEDEGLPADMQDDFRASGLYHLLSVAQLSRPVGWWRVFAGSFWCFLCSLLVGWRISARRWCLASCRSRQLRQEPTTWKATSTQTGNRSQAPKVYAGKVVTDRRKTRATRSTPQRRPRSVGGTVKRDDRMPKRSKESRGCLKPARPLPGGGGIYGRNHTLALVRARAGARSEAVQVRSSSRATEPRTGGLMSVDLRFLWRARRRCCQLSSAVDAPAVTPCEGGWTSLRPPRQRLCQSLGSGKRTRCRGEGDEEGVSLRVYLDSALLGARLAHDPAVLGESNRDTTPLPARAAAWSSSRRR